MADTTNKLDAAAQSFVAQCLASFMNAPETVAALIAKHGVEISEQTVHWYSRSPIWAPVIADLREKWTAGLADVAGASKRYRVQALIRLADKAEARKDLATARLCWESVRKELEGDIGAGASTAEIRVYLGTKGGEGDDPVDKGV